MGADLLVQLARICSIWVMAEWVAPGCVGLLDASCHKSVHINDPTAAEKCCPGKKCLEMPPELGFAMDQVVQLLQIAFHREVEFSSHGKISTVWRGSHFTSIGVNADQTMLLLQ